MERAPLFRLCLDPQGISSIMLLPAYFYRLCHLVTLGMIFHSTLGLPSWFLASALCTGPGLPFALVICPLHKAGSGPRLQG